MIMMAWITVFLIHMITFTQFAIRKWIMWTREQTVVRTIEVIVKMKRAIEKI